MREIKFRAWDGKRVYEVRSLHNLHSQVNVHADLCDDEGGLGTDRPAVATKYDVQLMQYTGLKDKNGVEIYEGDIVKRWDGEVSDIYWLGWDAGFAVRSHNGTGIFLELMKDSEVIGNIYENGDLLK